ncbi:lantibiotic dehydratase [Mucilaginibacter sp. AW1-3]
MASPFNLLDELILRSPLLSYQEYQPDNLDALLQNEWFKLAIYLASPDFYQRLALNNFSGKLLLPKEKVTLLKYYNRMSFRPIPFGVFSSFSTLTWAEGLTNVQLSPYPESRLKLLVDQAVAETFSKVLNNEVTDQTPFFGNPTLYRTNKEFRYIKTIKNPDSGKASYLLESFEANRFTKKLLLFLKQSAITYRDIITYIQTNTGCSDNEATEYFNFLITAQIVLSKHEVTLLGDDHLSQLAGIPFLNSPIKPALCNLLSRMPGIKFPNLPGVEQLVKDFANLFAKTGLTIPKQLFYANLERPATGWVDVEYQQQLKNALRCIQILTADNQPKMMADFIRKFKLRFDLQKVPLLQALDPETGIAYGASGAPDVANVLLQDMHFNQRNNKADHVKWFSAHKLLFSKWNSSASPRKEIVIDEQDLVNLEDVLKLPLPPSTSVMFRIYEDNIVIDAAGGASATALIGRFTLLSPAVKAIAGKAARHEQDSNPDMMFAEISLLSDNHVDNVNRRLAVYDYELAINTPPSLSEDKQIHAGDLVLSVVNDELILESVTMKKRVIPRLSSAYNHQNHQLNLFRFLGDLQHQGIHTSMTIDLEGMFPGMAFYPRVTYDKTILCLAKWYLSEKEVKYLTQTGAEESLQKVQQFKAEKLWPQYIALGHSDQQLAFNLEDKTETLFFLDCIRSESDVKITEQLMPYTRDVTNKEGKPLVNQFIGIILSANKAYRPLPRTITTTGVKQAREFITGSKWIYFKIYCAAARANQLLVKKILPVLQAVKTDGKIESWFFIRYVDTGPHIRLRINVKEEFLGDILVALKARLAVDVRYQLIQEYKADIYRRELERYGADIMADVEKVFEYSSDLVITYLNRTMAPAFSFTYHSLAMVTVAEIVGLFFPEVTAQLSFTQHVAHSFSLEHNDLKVLKFSLDKKYRSLKDEITQLLNNQEAYYKKLKLTALNLKLKESIGAIIDMSGNFTPERKAQLAADIIHMHLNRLFPDEQRYQELIIYHCLYKHLQTVIARSAKV